MKKQWTEAELKTLGMENTNEFETKDWPHLWECKGCGQHHYTEIFKCEICGGTDFKFTTEKPSQTTPTIPTTPVVS